MNRKMKLNLEKNKRELSLVEKVHYHKISLVAFTIPFIYLVSELSNQKFTNGFEVSHKISFFLILIALLIIWKKNKDLKLDTFQTRLNKNQLNREIEKLANEFNWKNISSLENQYEFKINASSFRSSNLLNFGEESKRYIDVIIVAHAGKFQLNLILNIDNTEIIEPLGEINQWEKIIVNRLK